MAHQKQINIRLDQVDMDKLEEIQTCLMSASPLHRPFIKRKYLKYTYTRQDVIIFLIRSYDLQINASNYDRK
jgi:hypothetical protein